QDRYAAQDGHLVVGIIFCFVYKSADDYCLTVLYYNRCLGLTLERSRATRRVLAQDLTYSLLQLEPYESILVDLWRYSEIDSHVFIFIVVGIVGESGVCSVGRVQPSQIR